MDQANWTFFYYCNAESDLFDNVITMVKNMATLNFPADKKVNVLLLIDRIKVSSDMDVTRFYTDEKYKWHKTLRFVLRKDLDPTVEDAQKSLEDLDMGDVENLKDFIKWGTQKFPADHYGIVFYGHGSGVSIGNMMEYKTPEDVAESFIDSTLTAINPDLVKDNENILESLDNFEFESNRFERNQPTNEALANFKDLRNSITARTGSFTESNLHLESVNSARKISRIRKKNSDLYTFEIREAFDELNFKPDLILFDSCFMMTYENALELRNSAKYLLASQGFHSRAPMGNQAFLQQLFDRPSLQPKALAEVIVNTFVERLEKESPEAPTVYNQPGTPPSVPDIFKNFHCYSCIDLSKVASFNRDFNALLEIMMKPATNGLVNRCVDEALNEIIAFYSSNEPESFFIGTRDLLFFFQCLMKKCHQSELNTLRSKLDICIEKLQELIVFANIGDKLITSTSPALNPTGLCIFLPKEREGTREWDGATMLNTYWYNKQLKLTALKNDSRWDDFILSRIADWNF